jgi:glycosyltransferase involved in cell wall biosynthesis
MTVMLPVIHAAPASDHYEGRAGQPIDTSLLRGPATVDVTVVIPFFNPGVGLRRTVLAVVDCLSASDASFEVIAVSDGSTDGSADTIGDIACVRVLANPRNEGKGAALHRGFVAAGGAWIGFIDADLDISPRHLVEYLRLARQGDWAGVYADKRHAGSESAATSMRKALSRTYSTFVSALFHLDVRDTQTGCKVFRRDVLAEVLPRLRERRFAFDLEFFVVARTAGITDFMPAAVNLASRVNGSTVCCRAVLRTLRDTLAVYGRHHLGAHHRMGARRALPIKMPT